MKFEEMKKEILKIVPKLVKATVAAVILKDNKILLEKRNVFVEKDKWCLPGGHIDFGETAEVTMKREIKEELNLETKNLKFIGYQDEIIPEIKNHSLVLIFGVDVKGDIKLDQKEVSEAKWLNKAELSKLKFAFKHKEIIDKYFLNKK